MSNPRRKPITKKIRFEVFKRDSFTCQYCGKVSPDTVLHVDHIEPVSKGGDNSLVNLITSCVDCNIGKGARRISDDSVVKKQRAQIKLLQSKSEQLEMMVAWHKELGNIKNRQVEAIAEYWSEKVGGHYSLGKKGVRDVEKLVKKFSVSEILEAIDAACDKLVYEEADDKPSRESAIEAFTFVAKICAFNRRAKDKPYLKDLYYIRGILKNRIYVNPWKAIQILEEAYSDGVSIDKLRHIATTTSNWTNWQCEVEQAAADARDAA